MFSRSRETAKPESRPRPYRNTIERVGLFSSGLFGSRASFQLQIAFSASVMECPDEQLLFRNARVRTSRRGDRAKSSL